MTIDQMPRQGQKAEPMVVKVPKTKLMIVRAEDTYRFLKHDFQKWLRTSHGITYTSLEDQMIKQCAAQEMNTILGAKTPHALPKARIIEVTL